MLDVADSNTVYYYHFDGFGSVVALSGESRYIVKRYSYDVFGKPNTTPTPYDFGMCMFTGRQYDSETGLYYYRARYYNPYIGRFLQTDPIGYKGGLNLYTYCKNNPINLIDPLGLSCGPGKIGDWMIPDLIFGGCCDAHDDCYRGEGPGGCSTSKQECDDNFCECVFTKALSEGRYWKTAYSYCLGAQAFGGPWFWWARL
jgi:RHS repeat-associated protein